MSSSGFDRKGAGAKQPRGDSEVGEDKVVVVAKMPHTADHAAARTFESINAARRSSSGSLSPVEAQAMMFAASATRLAGVCKFDGNDSIT